MMNCYCFLLSLAVVLCLTAMVVEISASNRPDVLRGKEVTLRRVRWWTRIRYAGAYVILEKGGFVGWCSTNGSRIICDTLDLADRYDGLMSFVTAKRENINNCPVYLVDAN